MCLKNQLGRSMIEMLGVLAIIAVLSVGGIAGYSKAMRMYKLNKYTQGWAELFAAKLRYPDATLDTLAAIGELPDVFDGNTDIFGNRIYDISWSYLKEMGIGGVGKNMDDDVCRTILSTLQKLPENFQYIYLVTDSSPYYHYYCSINISTEYRLTKLYKQDCDRRKNGSMYLSKIPLTTLHSIKGCQKIDIITFDNR